jgi:hypothetical protein
VADGERQWATGVLRRLGKQPTERNVSNLVGWAKAEGGHTNNDARYNYLNTTQPMPGAGNTGSQGNIKVYRNLEQGKQVQLPVVLAEHSRGIAPRLRVIQGCSQRINFDSTRRPARLLRCRGRTARSATRARGRAAPTPAVSRGR